MNYNKLKDILTAKNITIQHAAAKIGRSPNWFHQAVKKDTMTISDLEKILKLCKVSLAEFFGGEPGYNAVNETSEHESQLQAENLELLKENRQLRLRIDEMEVKNKGAGTIKPKLYK